MNREPLVAVPLFVFMGVMLERSHVARDLLAAMSRVFGSLPGGLAVSVTLVGMLLAASTGIVGATVVTLGLLALPAMLQKGDDPGFAAGTVAASGTLGQIIPPSIILIFLGDQLSIAHQSAQYSAGNAAPDTISVADLFAGALLPGLVLVGLYAIYQIVYSWRRAAVPAAAPLVPDGSAGLLRSLIAPLLLIVAVLGSILFGVATATEAASIGAVGAVMLAALQLSRASGWPIYLGAASLAGLMGLRFGFDLRLTRGDIPAGDAIAIGCAAALVCALAFAIAVAIRRIHAAKSDEGQAVLTEVVRATLRLTAMIFLIVIGASVFALVFRGFGGDRWIEGYLLDLPGGPVAALMLVIAVMFVLGFFLDFLEIIFVIVPVVAPVLLQMEVAPGQAMDPVWLGVMMALVLQTSFLTPPFGFALFYLRGVAPAEVGTLQIYRGVAPFVALQLVSLAVIWFWPGIATWLPAVLYGR